ncbi:hypothetical protein NIES4106_26080 [Fischerella sp. NIES-4106]|nr:hypothetical protein NIES4106_26080 [Fischerella sp. NIES-4106]
MRNFGVEMRNFGVEMRNFGVEMRKFGFEMRNFGFETRNFEVEMRNLCCGENFNISQSKGFKPFANSASRLKTTQIKRT